VRRAILMVENEKMEIEDNDAMKHCRRIPELI
jgi:hypothetical protein